MSQLNVNTIGARTGNEITIASGDNLYLPGNILQVVSATDTTATSYSIANTNQKLGSLELSITPKSTSSKIFLLCTVNLNCERYFSLNFYRDSTRLGDSAAATGSQSNMNVYANGGDFNDLQYQMLSTTFFHYDTPSTTSAITYSTHVVRFYTSTDTIYYNRPLNNTDASYIGRARSHITAMEIGG